MFDTLHRELALFERALGILTFVREDTPIGIRRLSRKSGHEHHETRAALRLLEDEGFIEATPEGAVPTKRAEMFFAGLDDSLDDVSARFDALSGLPATQPVELVQSPELERAPEVTHAKR
ncbi:hypothetical protein [Haladaptatus sp. DFWS20]|uniref:hypothetical protein n=1 Tax=Haladaptatus sp. DFWS20 TaxID=3403467 RepID=UPI003EB99752